MYVGSAFRRIDALMYVGSAFRRIDALMYVGSAFRRIQVAFRRIEPAETGSHAAVMFLHYCRSCPAPLQSQVSGREVIADQ